MEVELKAARNGGLHPSSRATYCAAVDNVRHLCALLAQLTAATPRVITIPDTERLSLDLSA